MADTRGVFSLKVARIFKSKGEWTPLDQVWSAPSGEGGTAANVGYFGGGRQTNAPYNHSTIDKVDFATDTGSALTATYPGGSREEHAATSSSVMGYWVAGNSPTGVTDKLDYSNDTVTTVPALVVGERERLAGTGNKAQVILLVETF